MTASLPSHSTAFPEFGEVIGDYPGSRFRYFWVIVWGAFAAWGILGALVQADWGGLLFCLALGAGCYAYYYLYVRYEVHAWLFRDGFTITRGGKTTSAYWDEVAKVEHAVTTWRYDFVIPVARFHSYRVVLRDGTRVKVTSSFAHFRQLGDTMQEHWQQALIERIIRARKDQSSQ